MNYIYNKSKSQNEIFDSNVKKMNEKLSDLAHEVFEKYKTEWHKFVAEGKLLKTGSWNRDDFHSQLDWSPATKRNPLPTWYKSLLKRKVNIASGGEEVVSHDLEITFSNRKAPTLLRIKYLAHPLVHVDKLGFGWYNKSGKFEKMVRTDSSKTAVSTVLSKTYLPMIQSGDIYSECVHCQKLLEFYVSHVNAGLYWRAYKGRIQDLMIVKNNCHEVILPRSVVHGTVTRRSKDSFFVVGKQGGNSDTIGVDQYKTFVAPEGKCYVSADVDSQEMWIAALLADKQAGSEIAGFTPISFMVCNGSKDAGTDVHTVTASNVGIDRNEAKILNYARLYMCGLKKAQENIGGENSYEKAKEMWELTKGKKTLKLPNDIADWLVDALGRLEELDLDEFHAKKFLTCATKYLSDADENSLKLNDLYTIHSVIKRDNKANSLRFRASTDVILPP